MSSIVRATPHAFSVFYEGCFPFGNYNGIASMYFGGVDDTDKDDEVRVTAIRAQPRIGTQFETNLANSPDLAKWAIARITSHQSNLPLAALAFNPSVSMPSQVVCYIGASVVSTSVYRTKLHARTLLYAAAGIDSNLSGVNYFSRTGRGYISRRAGGDSSRSMMYNRSGATVESIIIREGEGAALLSNGRCGWPKGHSIEMIVRDTSSGECFVYRALAPPPNDNNGAYISIMNGVGSGVVLSIESIEVEALAANNQGGLLGSSSELHFQISRMDGPRPYDAETMARTASVVAMDTNNSAPAGLSCIRGPLQPYYQSERTSGQGRMSWQEGFAPSGIGLSRNFFRGQNDIGELRRRVAFPPCTVSDVNTPTPAPFPIFDLFAMRTNGFDAIVLRKGEGLGLTADYMYDQTPLSTENLPGTSQLVMDVTMEFLYYKPNATRGFASVG